MVIFGHEFLLPVLHIAKKIICVIPCRLILGVAKSLVHFGIIHNNILLLPVLLEIIYQPLLIQQHFFNHLFMHGAQMVEPALS